MGGVLLVTALTTIIPSKLDLVRLNTYKQKDR